LYFQKIIVFFDKKKSMKNVIMLIYSRLTKYIFSAKIMREKKINPKFTFRSKNCYLCREIKILLT